MRIVGWLAAAALLAAGGCGRERASGPDSAGNEGAPASAGAAGAPLPKAPSADPDKVAEPAAAAEAAPDPPADAAPADLSPSRRRAYERGYRDCRSGRYAPERYSEAYRLGCAAAQQP